VKICLLYTNQLSDGFLNPENRNVNRTLHCLAAMKTDVPEKKYWEEKGYSKERRELARYRSGTVVYTTSYLLYFLPGICQ
jgi:hypothetical protein